MKREIAMEDNFKHACFWYFSVHFVYFILELMVKDHSSSFLNYIQLMIPAIGLIGMVYISIKEYKLNAEQKSNGFLIVAVLASVVFLLMICTSVNRLS